MGGWCAGAAPPAQGLTQAPLRNLASWLIAQRECMHSTETSKCYNPEGEPSPAHIPGLCRRKAAGRRGWESRLSTWLPPSSCEYPDVFLVTAFPHPPVPTQQTLDSLPKYIRITWPLPPLALLPSHSPHSPSLELCILWSVLLECSSPPLRVARSSHLLDLNLHFTSFEDLL